MKKIILIILFFSFSSLSYSEERNYSDGSKFVGEVKNGQLHGQGTYVWPDGRKYIGEFKYGEVHGQGTIFEKNGRKYIGEFKNGKFFKGTLTHSNGNTYFGEFSNDMPDGLGILTYLNGKKESGRFNNGRFVKKEDVSVLYVSEIINLNKCYFKDQQKVFDEKKLEYFTVQINNLKKIVTVDIIFTYDELNRIRNTKNTKENVTKEISVIYNIDSKKDEIIKAITIRNKEIEKLEINLDTLEVIQGNTKIICSN